VHDEERRGAGGAVDVFDGSEIYGRGPGDVDEGAADEIADVDLVRGERRAISKRDGNERTDEGFGGGDGVNAGEVEHDAALVRPVVNEFNFARRR